MTTHHFYSFPVTSCVHFVHNSYHSVSPKKAVELPVGPTSQQEII